MPAMEEALPRSMLDPLPERDVYTVSRLNREARALLEGEFPLIWIEGEISNLACPSSGHLYFSLKDQGAQVRCAMFRHRNQVLRFRPADGMHVLARARLSLYEPRGDFQLIVEHLEEAGDGALRRAFERLKQRLAAEGLFDAARKKPLPVLPKRIGVITSPTGAAIRDVLTILERRFAAIPVLIYPTAVQGKSAAPEIARAIRLASNRAECDVLILCRGGGSIEDLWAYNEEIVARAIAESAIPIISGVGHEIDVTIADFAADMRAPTPSGAAEHAVPDSSEWLRRFRHLEERIIGRMRDALRTRAERSQWLLGRLNQQHPGSRLRLRAQRLDELEQRLARGVRARIERCTMMIDERRARLMRHVPLHQIVRLSTRCADLARRLEQGVRLRQLRARNAFASLARALDTLSPLATLGRGYAIVRRGSDGAVITDAGTVEIGDEVRARLARGELICEIKRVES
jgi:exodeoxyribonuclease VII large subunit